MLFTPLGKYRIQSQLRANLFYMIPPITTYKESVNIPEGMSDNRYDLKNLKQALKQPGLFLFELTRAYHKVSLWINRVFYDRISPQGVDIMNRDWDNLIILDACRYDFFQYFNMIDGELSEITSKGSESWEFMEENFVGKSFHDTVYVTANPHSSKLPTETFHSVVNLLESHWVEDESTVLPEDMVAETLRIQEDFPNKRIISHFMQPHYPFIGELGSSVEHRGIRPTGDTSSEKPNPWIQLTLYSGVDAEQTISAYKENHEIAINHAADLVDGLEGKTVVTADHANLLGEWTFPVPKRIFGHPRNFHKRELISVPWLEIDSGTRRKIVSEDPIKREQIEQEIVDKRLQDLGYM